MAKKPARKPAAPQPIALMVQPVSELDVQNLGSLLLGSASQVARFSKLTGLGNAQAFAQAQSQYASAGQQLSIIAATHPEFVAQIQNFFTRAQNILLAG